MTILGAKDKGKMDRFAKAANLGRVQLFELERGRLSLVVELEGVKQNDVPKYRRPCQLAVWSVPGNAGARSGGDSVRMRDCSSCGLRFNQSSSGGLRWGKVRWSGRGPQGCGGKCDRRRKRPSTKRWRKRSKMLNGRIPGRIEAAKLARSIEVLQPAKGQRSIRGVFGSRLWYSGIVEAKQGRPMAKARDKAAGKLAGRIRRRFKAGGGAVPVPPK